jgi:hypothetical protein
VAESFLNGVKWLGWALFSFFFLLLLIYAFAVGVLRLVRWLNRRVQEQIDRAGDEYAESIYEITTEPSRSRAWRKERGDYSRQMEAIGWRHLVDFVNRTSESYGRPNHHANWVAQNGGTVFSISQLTMERTWPWIGLNLPWPRWTGVRTMGWCIETRLEDGRLLLSMEGHEDSRWPDYYVLLPFDQEATLQEQVANHLRDVGEYLTAGAVVRCWKDKEDYMESHNREHRVLAALMRENFDEIIQKMEDCLEEIEDPDQDNKI